MPALTDLPVELFLDNILPLLPVPDLLHFGCVNRHFAQLSSDETFWHRKIEEDYNFSGSETARKNGWKFLYRRFSHPRVFVWGERSQGRLGLNENQLPPSVMRDGVPFPVQLRIPGSARIVGLIAGGWSFHALDSRGRIFVWGALDGTSAALRSEGYSIPSKRTEGPMLLNLPVKMRSISCGRSHCAALDVSSHVWTCTSWGRPFILSSHLLDKSSPETTPTQITSGWSFSAILTESGDVLVFWPFSGGMADVIAAKTEEFDQQSVTLPTRALPTDQESSVIPCYIWTMQGVDPVRLPVIPKTTLPELRGTGVTVEGDTKLIKIAGMNNTIVGLTNKGHVLIYSLLGGENQQRRSRWEYLPDFSEVEKIREHETLTSTPPEGQTRPEPPETMFITHISAQFRTFVAYSMGDRSVVIMGKVPDLGPAPLNVSHVHSQISPIIHPALQNRNVISVVLGDYHYGALTADGKLLTWGAYSKGALGLGDPTRIPLGQPGGFVEENQLRAAATRWGILRLPPPDVTAPTEVRFDHGEKRRRERYCFAAAAAGWHMGALVIDLEVRLRH
ncbi:RCC1/BLIP-II protein [Daedalea quercina L-15889]|uniref:RCC1/BLIP-II protein n=1 Tax=Daedalea quercina L-15889 TaxID=1314783 RepID=A0A165QBJ5_9APHY|nr:RCC1/BLIP-II protein [Daedalea quercina L-15889]